MSATWNDALAELTQFFGGGRYRIVRTDVGADGSLTFCVDGPLHRAWFRYDDRGLVPSVPEHDPKLSLSGWLATSGRSAQVLAYRPGRRLVLLDDGGPERKIIKGYRRRRSYDAARRHGEVARTAAGSFRVPAILRHDRERSAVVFEWIGGEPLKLAESEVEDAFRLGTTLARFQAAAVPKGFSSFGPIEELRVLETWRSKLERIDRGLPARWLEVARELEEQAALLPEPVWGLAHRDLHDGQLARTDRGLVLFDLDLACRADVTLDPANLLAHFSLRGLQGLHGADENSVHLLGEAFLDGLDRERDPGFWPRLRFYQATSFLRLALVYALRPRWAHLSEELVHLGRRCSEELARSGSRTC